MINAVEFLSTTYNFLSHTDYTDDDIILNDTIKEEPHLNPNIVSDEMQFDKIEKNDEKMMVEHDERDL